LFTDTTQPPPYSITIANAPIPDKQGLETRRQGFSFFFFSHFTNYYLQTVLGHPHSITNTR
jgi:hypothetical protein